jgi:hypothetical protein
MRPLILGAFALAALTSAAPARAGNPWEEMFGPEKGKLWTDPSARFYLELPVGWSGTPRKGAPSIVDFHKEHPDNRFVARFVVEMRQIPPGVKVGHFAARVEDEVKEKARAFRLIERDKIDVSGATGHRIYFTHQEHNNAELTDEVVQTVFLQNERAFIITFECAAGTRPVFWEDYERMMKSFVGRGVGEETLPVPKKKRPMRSGEMINPNTVPY